MNFFLAPPELNVNVPKFLMKRKLISSARKMIHWAISEYLQAIDYYRQIGDARSVKFIESRMSGHLVLSKHPDFKRLCSLIDSEIFNSLDRQERRFLTVAWQHANRTR